MLVAAACWWPASDAAAGPMAAGSHLLHPGPPLLNAPAPHSPQLSRSSPFSAAPLLVSGTDAYRHGEYLYQDYLFDDHGADTAPGPGSSLANVNGPPLFSPTGGDVLYPTDGPYRGNAADLVELGIKPTAAAIVYRITLNTVLSPGTAVVGIGIDRHRRGGAPVDWPYGAGVATPGLDAFITAWGTGGAITRFAAGTTTPLPPGHVSIDTTTRQMTIVVPRSIMDPGHATWRYVAGTGLWDGHRWTAVGPGASAEPDRPVSGNPLTGAPAVLNLAFRFHEPAGSMAGSAAGLPGYSTQPGTGSWFEDQQARDLAQGTTGGNYADVDFKALATGATEDPHPPGRVQARIFASRLPVPQGVDHSGPFPEYGGQLQPYLVTLPPHHDPAHPAPLTFALHPSLGGYTVFHVFMPNWAAELGAGRDSILVTNLARGINGPEPDSGAYVDEAEADFFETWADVARHFHVDAGRVTLTGYSLGAYADYQLAEEWPDLFANVFAVVGAPPSNGRNTELLGNLRWVPILSWNQLDDSEVPYDQVHAAQSTLQALGLRHEAWLFPAGGHLAPALRDDWRPAVGWLGHARATRDPSRIVYGFYPSLDAPRLGLVHDHVYWISGLRAADYGTPSPTFAEGQLDARSRAFGEGDPAAEDYSGTGSAGGAQAAVQGTRWTGVPHAHPINELDLDLRNVGAATIDGRRARLDGGRPLTIRVSADHPARLHLDLPLPKRVRTHLHGPAGASVVTSPQGATLGVPAGGATFTLVPD